MHTITLSPETFSRLQAHAEPLVDTVESVIRRALDALEGNLDRNSGTGEQYIVVYDPANPPSLSFTSVKSVVVAGRRHPPSEAYWNSIMVAVVREAGKAGKTAAEIGEMLLANYIEGKKEGGGYKFIEESGLSVQGQDANSAWRAAFHIAEKLKIKIEVLFDWQNTQKAAFPGGHGRMVVG